MKLFPEGRSKALSGLSLAAAALCCIMAVKAFTELLTLFNIFSSPGFLLGLGGSSVPVEMPPLAGLIARNIRAAFLFSFFFWFSGLALALGVWGRREWARQGAAWMLYLLSAAALLLLLFPWLAIPRPLVYDGVALAPDFNAAVGAAAFLARLVALLGGSVCLWWALALDRGRLKVEFQPKR